MRKVIPRLLLLAHRFHRDERGNYVWLVLFGLFVLISMVALIANVGEHINKRIETQNAADAVAISSTSWIARDLNLISANNVAQAHLIAGTVIYQSLYNLDRPASGKGTGDVTAWGDFQKALGGLIFQAGDAICKIPYVGAVGVAVQIIGSVVVGGGAAVVTQMEALHEDSVVKKLQDLSSTKKADKGILWEWCKEISRSSEFIHWRLSQLAAEEALACAKENGAAEGYILPPKPQAPITKGKFKDFARPVTFGFEGDEKKLLPSDPQKNQPDQTSDASIANATPFSARKGFHEFYKMETGKGPYKYIRDDRYRALLGWSYYGFGPNHGLKKSDEQLVAWFGNRVSKDYGNVKVNFAAIFPDPIAEMLNAFMELLGFVEKALAFLGQDPVKELLRFGASLESALSRVLDLSFITETILSVTKTLPSGEDQILSLISPPEVQQLIKGSLEDIKRAIIKEVLIKIGESYGVSEMSAFKTLKQLMDNLSLLSQVRTFTSGKEIPTDGNFFKPSDFTEKYAIELNARDKFQLNPYAVALANLKESFVKRGKLDLIKEDCAQREGFPIWHTEWNSYFANLPPKRKGSIILSQEALDRARDEVSERIQEKNPCSGGSSAVDWRQEFKFDPTANSSIMGLDTKSAPQRILSHIIQIERELAAGFDRNPLWRRYIDFSNDKAPLLKQIVAEKSNSQNENVDPRLRNLSQAFSDAVNRAIEEKGKRMLAPSQEKANGGASSSDDWEWQEIQPYVAEKPELRPYESDLKSLFETAKSDVAKISDLIPEESWKLYLVDYYDEHLEFITSESSPDYWKLFQRAYSSAVTANLAMEKDGLDKDQPPPKNGKCYTYEDFIDALMPLKTDDPKVVAQAEAEADSMNEELKKGTKSGVSPIDEIAASVFPFVFDEDITNLDDLLKKLRYVAVTFKEKKADSWLSKEQVSKLPANNPWFGEDSGFKNENEIGYLYGSQAQVYNSLSHDLYTQSWNTKLVPIDGEVELNQVPKPASELVRKGILGSLRGEGQKLVHH